MGSCSIGSTDDALEFYIEFECCVSMLCENTDKPKDPSVECEMTLYCTEIDSSFLRWSSKPVADCLLVIVKVVMIDRYLGIVSLTTDYVKTTV